METLKQFCQQDPALLLATPYRIVDLTHPQQVEDAIAWWTDLTSRGGEGMVVKPIDYITKSPKGLVQPAVKCRGHEYLRIIYGPDYDLPGNLERLRKRGVGAKRSLAEKEFVLGAEALERALDADRVSAFGGIVALNGAVDRAAADHLAGLFLECVVAPSFSEEARQRLAAKANLRLLELDPRAVAEASGRLQLRSVLGGVLAQQADDGPADPDSWQVVSDRQPSASEWLDLRFAWQVVRHVRSNAILVAQGGRSLGVGAGQMNRVGSARLALEAAGEAARGAVLASDGFFPFDDTVLLAARHGITAVIQPGGSKRDPDSIAACKANDMVMVITGRRHFLH
jgi:AICAR transformylase/IMP cyclohydrolase PurH